jgi:hypothetical protein
MGLNPSLVAVSVLLSLGVGVRTYPKGHSKAESTPKTICTITINSSDEKEIFTKHLAPKGFVIRELVPEGGDSGGEGDQESWFAKACADAEKSKLKCDALVISGHFGGTFFGSSGKSLSLEELESQSCAKTCNGILRNPSAVYLFGCNTLAGKEKDHRTPEQYLQVLLSDGIGRAAAERVVEARYGSTGQTNRDRMLRVFEGSPRVYGFDSVGPSGKNVRGFLDQYFTQNPNYAKHLDALAAERANKDMTALLQSFSQINNKQSDPFQCSLKNTSVTCANGVCQSNREINDLLCSIRDRSKPLSERLRLLAPLLKGKDGLAYVPIAIEILKDMDVNKLSNVEYAAYLELQDNPELKAQLKELIAKPTRLIDQKFAWIDFAKKMSWLSEAEHTAAVDGVASPLIADFRSRETRDLFYSHASQLRGMSASNQRKLAGFLNDPDSDVRMSAVYALGEIKPADSAIHDALASSLKDPESYVRWSAAEALGKIKPTDPAIHSALASSLKDPESGVRGYAAQALGEIKPTDPAIHSALASSLKDPESGVRGSAAKALGMIKPSDPATIGMISGFLKDPDPDVRESAAVALGMIKPTAGLKVDP